MAKEDPCWDGYEMVGMKMKNGRKVPNCVPKKKRSIAEETTSADIPVVANVVAKKKKKEIIGERTNQWLKLERRAREAKKKREKKWFMYGRYWTWQDFPHIFTDEAKKDRSLWAKLKREAKNAWDHFTEEREILEASLSRFARHSENRAIGMMSAHRKEATKQENKARTRKLESMIKSAGYGFVKMKGQYIEDKDTPTEQTVIETSFFIVGPDTPDTKLEKNLRRWGKMFSQDSVLYKPQETNRAYLIGLSNSGFPGLGKHYDVGRWSPTRAEDFYSEWHNRSFVFKEAIEQYEEDEMISEARKLNLGSYQIYHNSFSSAVQYAERLVNQKGYSIDPDDWFREVATGPAKPRVGKTNRYSLNLQQDEKYTRNWLHIQVYGMDSGKYELNMYVMTGKPLRESVDEEALFMTALIAEAQIELAKRGF